MSGIFDIVAFHPRPRMEKPTYIQWMSVRHTDGRRQSGVGRNISLWHIQKPGDDYHALCGKEIQIQMRGKLIDRPVCSMCKRIYEKTKTHNG